MFLSCFILKQGSFFDQEWSHKFFRFNKHDTWIINCDTFLADLDAWSESLSRWCRNIVVTGSGLSQTRPASPKGFLSKSEQAQNGLRKQQFLPRVFLKRELFPGCVATVSQVVYVARLSQAGIQKVLKALLYATQCDNTAESKWICAKCVAFLSHVYFPLRVPFNESLQQADWKETWPQRQTELSVFTMERIKTPSIR